MYCPRCGAENDDGNRFCVNCGSELPSRQKAPRATTGKERPRGRDRLLELLGATRRARLVTVATVAALAIALVAFLSLDSGGDATAESPYLQSLDQACVSEKERIVALEREALSQQPPDLREFASVLVIALAEWREGLQQEAPPPEHAQAVQALEASLVTTLIEAGKLSRSIREGDSAKVISRQARAVDEATGEVDAVIEDMGLSDCTELQVAPAGSRP